MTQSARAVALASLVLACLTAQSLGASAVVDAATVDWVTRANLPSEVAAALATRCEGQYVDPTPGGPLPENTLATADRAERVENVSTTLTGSVSVTRGTLVADGSRMTLDETTDIATISGPMQFRERGLLVRGDHAVGNLFDGNIAIDNASFLLHQNHIRGASDRLARAESGKITLRGGNFTRCEPGQNTWSIAGQQINLDPAAGWGTARNVTLRVKDIPVAYSPYLRFPINDARQSGWLMPSLSFDDENGVEFGAPYYFNLAPNYDATYLPRSVWKRGFLHEGQLRYRNRQTVNELNLGLLRQDDKFDDRDIVDQTSLNLAPPFRKQDRWFVNVRHTGGWDRNWRSSLRYSAVSDIDYLHDIGGDVDSVAVEQFLSRVDTTLGNRRSASLDRAFHLEYTGANWAAGVRAQAFQSLNPNAGSQYELLPGFTGRYKRALGPTELSVFGSLARFDTDATSGALAVTGDRLLAEADLTLPLRRSWGFLEPRLSVSQRSYRLSNTVANQPRTPSHTMPVVSVKGGLFFERPLSIRGTSLLQTLEPAFFYLYVPEENQDQLPQFDVSLPVQSFATLFRHNRFSGTDRLGDANQVALALTTRLLSASSGAQWLSASLGQVQYLSDRSVLFNQPAGLDPRAARSALFSTATLSLNQALQVRTTLNFDPEDSVTHKGSISLSYSPDLNHIINVSYRYANAAVEQASGFANLEQSDVSFIWPVARNVSLIGRWNFGWDDNETIESFFGIEFDDCCWKSRLVWRRFLKDPRNLEIFVADPASPSGFTTFNRLKSRPDTGIFFEFQLKGLATFGRRLDSLLDQAIVGYRDRENLMGK